MRKEIIKIYWPNGKSSLAKIGEDWLKEAEKEGVNIPTGCLTGSCGACEIEVNGKVLRACVNSICKSKTGYLKVRFWEDPYW